MLPNRKIVQATHYPLCLLLSNPLVKDHFEAATCEKHSRTHPLCRENCPDYKPDAFAAKDTRSQIRHKTTLGPTQAVSHDSIYLAYAVSTRNKDPVSMRNSLIGSTSMLRPESQEQYADRNINPRLWSSLSPQASNDITGASKSLDLWCWTGPSPRCPQRW